MNRIPVMLSLSKHGPRSWRLRQAQHDIDDKGDVVVLRPAIAVPNGGAAVPMDATSFMLSLSKHGPRSWRMLRQAQHDSDVVPPTLAVPNRAEL
jgi:hypothetical protein